MYQPTSLPARSLMRRSEEHTSELQSHRDLHSFPTRRTSELAYAIGDPRIHDLRFLDVAALADVPAHVVAGEIAHAERSHRHAEALKRTIDLRRRSALLEEEQGLAQILLEHAIADEAVAHARDHCGLADLFGEPHDGDQNVGRRSLAAHDFQQLHHVRRAEEVHADDVCRAARHSGDPVEIERRGVARENCTLLRNLVELAEYLLLDLDVFEYRLDDEVRIGDIVVGKRRREQCHAALERLRGELAPLERALVVPADRRHTLVKHLFIHLEQGDRNAGAKKIHRDTAAHRAGTDDSDALDLAR